MRQVLLVGVFAVFLIVMGGCGRNGATWIGIREMIPPANVPFGTVRSMQAAEPLAVGQSTGWILQNSLRPSHPVTDEIEHDIADNRIYWSEYQSGLCKQPRIFESGPELSAKLEVDLTKPPVIPAQEINPAVRLKHRNQFVNLQLRIAVLESRIAASGETGSRELAAKLEEAREQLRSLNALCIAESDALSN